MVPSILIVEDDLTFSTMLKTWLGKKGFEVETASTQAKARKQIGTRDFDLILSDLRLPDQDGLSLLSWLREQGTGAFHHHDQLCGNSKCRTCHEGRSH